MSRVRRRLHGEAVRHALSIAASTILIVGITATIALVTQGRFAFADSLLVGMTLVFAAYGPIFVWLTHLAFGRLRGAALRARLQRTTERNRLMQLLFIGGPKTWAALIAAVGVASVIILATGDARSSIWLVGACVACVVGTWVLLVGVFAAEYMRAWASGDVLRFPGDGDVGFEDFVYLSVQLSTTFASSDVDLVDTSARRLATVHSIVAFAYSTVIVAVFASLLIAGGR
ncbi:DUF1345 domain-containing protein [Agrococcus jejuensis]|uniref:Uncharacterized membrane protein n=1 Tax=Agrococcus jejuensis TaxID=399736 RepID=A0A1G8E5Y1_9MICO|nr:DUF1345 domain-containing protein [Agrococcus jejuensis]SDH65264.1 Uncharacterized membrane protein [Agrococcus jejuensis]